MIIAVSFAIKSNQVELLQRMLSTVLEIEPHIVDLQTHSLVNSPSDTLLVFGSRAKRLIKESSGRILYLPELDKLEPEPCNENTRYEIYQELCKLKSELSRSVVLTVESLPDLNTNAVAALEAQLRAKGETTWHGVTKEGKSICLSILPAPQTNAEVVLTFAELFTLRAAMETLQIRELCIGRNSKADNSSNSK